MQSSKSAWNRSLGFASEGLTLLALVLSQGGWLDAGEILQNVEGVLKRNRSEKTALLLIAEVLVSGSLSSMQSFSCSWLREGEDINASSQMLPVGFCLYVNIVCACMDLQWFRSMLVWVLLLALERLGLVLLSQHSCSRRWYAKTKLKTTERRIETPWWLFLSWFTSKWITSNTFDYRSSILCIWGAAIGLWWTRDP